MWIDRKLSADWKKVTNSTSFITFSRLFSTFFALLHSAQGISTCVFKQSCISTSFGLVLCVFNSTTLQNVFTITCSWYLISLKMYSSENCLWGSFKIVTFLRIGYGLDLILSYTSCKECAVIFSKKTYAFAKYLIAFVARKACFLWDIIHYCENIAALHAQQITFAI